MATGGSIHGLAAVAPLKLGEVVSDEVADRAIHGLAAVAPLKRRGILPQVHLAGLHPRPRGRGPIEAEGAE